MALKKNIALGSVVVILLFVAVRSNVIKLPLVMTSEASYLPGLEDDRVLVGASHNVFIGKVLKKAGQTEGIAGPLTQFEIQVVSNIKGVLPEKVTISQEGGYENGILRLVEGQTLMKVGTTYVFTTRGNEKWGYLATSYPRGWFVISTDAKLSLSKLKALAATNKTVLALQNAYTQEIPLQADVESQNALNSYASLFEK